MWSWRRPVREVGACTSVTETGVRSALAFTVKGARVRPLPSPAFVPVFHQPGSLGRPDGGTLVEARRHCVPIVADSGWASEVLAQDEADGARLGGMGMNVSDRACLARKAGRVEVVDLVRPLVENVVGVEPDGEAVGERVAEARRDRRTRTGPDAVVLDQRTGPEIAHLHAAEPTAPDLLEAEAGADHAFRGAGDVAPRRCRIVGRETRIRVSRVEIEMEPGGEGRVQRILHTDATARSRGFRGARIADEHDLGIEVEDEGRQRAGRPLGGTGAHADLGALRAHEEGRPIHRRARSRIEGRHRAARIVAVKAGARVEITLRLGPRSEHEAEFRTDDARRLGAGIGGEGAGDGRLVKVGPRARRRAQPGRPSQRVLGEHADRDLFDAVIAHRR